MAAAPATIGHDMDVPEIAASLQEMLSAPSLLAEYIWQSKAEQSRVM